jgi:hypothetical protein
VRERGKGVEGKEKLTRKPNKTKQKTHRRCFLLMRMMNEEEEEERGDNHHHYEPSGEIRSSSTPPKGILPNSNRNIDVERTTPYHHHRQHRRQRFREIMKRECLKRMKEARQRIINEKRQRIDDDGGDVLSLLVGESEQDVRYQVENELRYVMELETPYPLLYEDDEQHHHHQSSIEDEGLTQQEILDLVEELELEWKQIQDSSMLEEQLEFEERTLSALIADYEEQKCSLASMIPTNMNHKNDSTTSSKSNKGDDSSSRSRGTILCPLCRQNIWYITYNDGFIRCVCGLSIDIQVSHCCYVLLDIISDFLSMWGVGRECRAIEEGGCDYPFSCY